MLWKASFIIRNYIFEKPFTISYKPPFTSEIRYEILPKNKGTMVSIIFDTDQISKPDFLQKRRAKMLFSMFKEVSSPFVVESFDAELAELTPVSEKDKREYNDMKSPDEWRFTPKPKIVKSDVTQKIEKTFFIVHPSKLMFTGKDASNYRSLMVLRTMLKGYDRSLEYKGLLDKFVSLWVTFNVIYDCLWKYNHPKTKLPRYHPTRISDCILCTLNQDECKQILQPYKFVLASQMPPYELIVPRGEEEKIDEIVKSKDIKEIEVYHKNFLEKEKDWRLNKKDSWLEDRGFNFGKYWFVEDWVNSLAQVLLNIYGLRNTVFHSGEIPMEAVEGIVDNPDDFQYWSMRNDILAKVDALLITKILNHFN